ncbi:hypothetical protein AK88_03264 [Plasmodium fragile]|uniref:Uncharacterized protein n=1 Tax=Plasmodium fragile TaxID=5857 RepID=A0A0D9QN23_PLAFR|nr:uncharacterized protein AK88_03264 [Plasmodium fragile]KJP87096.1 hypothetical protein AK88_03264 [Plasmodium fragile]
MILTERKKKLEIGIYQKEVHEQLQEAYEQDKFAKYVNEEKFDTFICEGKKNNGGCVVVVEENHVKHWRDEKTNSGVVYKGTDAVMSFRRFAGKEIHLHQEDTKQSISGMDKLKRIGVKGRSKNGNDGDTLLGLPSGHDVGRDVFERVDQIRHAVAEVRRTIRNKIDLSNSNKNVCSSGDDMTELYLSFAQLRDNFDELTTIKRCVTSRGQEENGQVKGSNYILLDCKLDGRGGEEGNHENYVSLRQTHIYRMLQELQAKVEQYEWLLTEGCSHEEGRTDQEQSVGHTLLSIAMFLNLCMNENIGKRILNYIYLQKIEIKKCKQYLVGLNKGNSLNIFCSHVESVTKGVPREEDPATFVDKVFRINLTEHNEQVLTLYKRLLHSELGVDLMLREMEKVNSTVGRIFQHLDSIRHD